MRKIKFRGKGIVSKEWYYGDLVQVYNKENNKTHYYIITEEYSSKSLEIELGTCTSPEIDPETLGQFTGLEDKNGEKIWEGDTIEIKYRDEDIGKVIYEHNRFAIDVMNMNRPYGRVDFINNFIEVIGNIYDNPELLEVGD